MLRTLGRSVSVVPFVAIVTLTLALAAAQSGTPSVGKNPPPESGENPVPPQNAKNASLTSVTGEVSDSYCLRHHYMLAHATDAECVRYCIAHQANYVVISGKNIYNLHNVPGHTLDSLADKQVRVTGWLVKPDTIEIQSVSPVSNASK